MFQPGVQAHWRTPVCAIGQEESAALECDLIHLRVRHPNAVLIPTDLPAQGDRGILCVAHRFAHLDELIAFLI